MCIVLLGFLLNDKLLTTDENSNKIIDSEMKRADNGES